MTRRAERRGPVAGFLGATAALALTATAMSQEPARAATARPGPGATSPLEPTTAERTTPADATIAAPASVNANDVAQQQPVSDAAKLPLDEVLSRLGPGAEPRKPEGAAPAAGSDDEKMLLKRFIRAREAMTQGKVTKAIIDLEEARKIDPTDVNVLRELAHGYTVVGNEALALEAYERLLAVLPDDRETLVALGIGAAGHHKDEDAVRRLGRVLQLGKSPDGPHLAGAARVLGDVALGASLRQLGFEAASTQAWQDAIEAQGPEEEAPPEMIRTRADLLRSIGDANLRIGNYRAALESYQKAQALPGYDPAVMMPRVLLTLARSGRAAESERRLALQLKEKDRSLTEQDAELVEWMVARPGDHAMVRDAAAEAMTRDPGNPFSARMTAAADPARAEEAYAAALKKDPGSRDALNGLFRAAAARSAESLAKAYLERLVAAPEYGAFATQAAFSTNRSERELRHAIDALPASPAREAALARLANFGRDYGAAWTRLAAAREKAPADVGLAVTQLETAGLLEEPTLVFALEKGAPGSASGLPDDPRVKLAAGVALRAGGDAAGARARLEPLMQSASPPAATRMELARVLTDLAASTSVAELRQRVELSDAGTDLALKALEENPANEDAAGLLLRISDPRTGLRPDAGAYNAVRTKVRNDTSLSWLDDHIAIDEDLARGRADVALARLLRLAEKRPFDSEIVGQLTTAMVRFGRGQEILEWLAARQKAQPALLSLRDAALAAAVQLGGEEAALARLESELKEDPGDALAAWHYEALLRVMKRWEDATTLSRERLLARPAGPRRSLELANLEGRGQRPGEAIVRLQEAMAAPSLTAAQRVAALKVAASLQPSLPGRNELVQKIADDGLKLGDDQVMAYAATAALAAWEDARGGSPSELNEALTRIRELGNRAVATPVGGDATLAAAMQWHDAAQVLLDSHAAAAAAELVRARLLADRPLDPQAFRVLVSTAFASDAVAGDRTRASIELLRTLREKSLRPFAWTRSGAEKEAEALYELSSLYTVVGTRAGSEEILKEAIASDPAYAMALNNLAWSRVERGELNDETIKLAEKAAGAAGDESSVIDTLGWIRYLQGRFADSAAADGAAAPGAVTLLERAAKLNENDPSLEVLDHLGDALWRSGMKDRARAAWSQLVRIGAERFDRKAMLPLLQGNLQVETGIKIDAEHYYDDHFGAVIERARQKVADIDAGREPRVAPLAGVGS